MKKLLMAAVIACAAVSAQALEAAEWTWTASGIYAAGGGSLSEGTKAYLSETLDRPQYQIVPLLLNTELGGYSFLKEYFTETGNAITATIAADGSFSTTVKTTMSDSTGYFMVFNDATESIYFSSTTDWLSAGGTLAFGDQTTASSAAAMSASGGYKGAGWYTASSVPEPTSGLLLLLGMAGLALKRKIA